MPACLIGLGSNLGNRGAILQQAIKRIERHRQMSLAGSSSWRQTAAIGGPADQPPFLNAAAVVKTSLPPASMLRELQKIESALGRRRGGRWEPRTIDLDLLLYEQEVRNTPTLVLPHPRMAWRRFVLEPAAEVAAAMVHPVIGWTMARLLEHLDTALPYVAITGAIGAGKTELAERLARRTSARLVAEDVDFARLERFYAAPASHAWATELEFVEQRARLLAADRAEWSDYRQLVISDFWFDQSPAFARVWLPAEQQEAYRREFERARQGVVEPKLIVLLDAPAEQLHRRVLLRGRGCERKLSRGQLDQIRRSVVSRATMPGHGPVLKLTDVDLQQALQEVLAAIKAME